MHLFAIYDSKAKTFSAPINDDSVAAACRSFQTVCNEPKTPYNQFPDDFSLVLVGRFDRQTGKIEELNQDLGLARSFIKQ